MLLINGWYALMTRPNSLLNTRLVKKYIAIINNYRLKVSCGYLIKCITNQNIKITLTITDNFHEMSTHLLCQDFFRQVFDNSKFYKNTE